jgi:GT2 family glycosyltransferase
VVSGMQNSMSLSVIIVTLNRAECLRICLEKLAAQQPHVHQVVVVDGSADDSTRKVVAEFTGVIYIRNEKGYGHMTHSRNLGLMTATGDVIAFIDDDAFARPGWAANLVAAYSEEKIGAVGGRAMNRHPAPEGIAPETIGQLLPNGHFTTFFDVDAGRRVRVDHLIGCNISFRRTVLAKLGGLREDYTGTETREETDICFRVRNAGYTLIYEPAACVDHVGAPQSKGKRFDLRYDYYAQRNHMVLLIQNFGVISAYPWRHLGRRLIEHTIDCARKVVGGFARYAVVLSGTAVGIFAGCGYLARNGGSFVRRDELGNKIAAHLSGNVDPPINSPITETVPAEGSFDSSKSQQPLLVK